MPSGPRNLDFVDASIRYHMGRGDQEFAGQIGALLAELWDQGELRLWDRSATTVDVIQAVSEKAVLIALAALREQEELFKEPITTSYFDQTYLIRSV